MSDSAIFNKNTQVIVSGDMSQATITSTAVNITGGRHVALHAEWSGTAPVGTIALQGSNDGVNFRSIQAASAVTGTPGGLVLNFPNLALVAVNVLYTKTSGTGTLNAFVSLKE